jgi:oxygen-independent coproporphyrinogen III oxidase
MNCVILLHDSDTVVVAYLRMSGVYISYPFCAQKCTFCNFASGVSPVEGEYPEAIIAELATHKWEWIPDTAYIGGGTPSRLDGEMLRKILDSVPGKPWREATIEAAPGSLNAQNVRAWVSAGINRVSLGVQSFVKQELARTGRKHDADIVKSDCELLREYRITNINIDLIAGLPFQTPESWRESLDWIERLRPPHVSVYMFEIDEDSRLGLEILNNGTRFGAPAVPTDDAAAEFYEIAVERLRAVGIERYEISNFARPGMESLHNLKYWQLEPYRGFGADAHSFDGRQRYANVETAAEYVDCWRNGLPVQSEQTEAFIEEERLFLGLRLMRGIKPAAEEWSQFDRAIDAGLLTRDGDSVRLTDKGVLLSNEVFQEFITA